MNIDFEVVPMNKVPDPPIGESRVSKYAAVWEAIANLAEGESSAVKFKCKDQKQFLYVRAAMRKKALGINRRLLSSRNANSTAAYFWLEEAKKK